MDFSPNLLKVLSCPASGGKLIYSKIDNELVSEKAGLAYPIVDEIPILLTDKARKVAAAINREHSQEDEVKNSKKSRSFKVA